tara:strand:+ start:684 stop:920 length:237 start_codon:yes stop_codon:yes gene_type:complete
MSTPLRYELAWNYIWEGYSNWKKSIIVNEPDTRQGKEFSKEFSHEVAKLAESNREIPAVKTNRVVQAKPQLRISGVKE